MATGNDGGILRAVLGSRRATRVMIIGLTIRVFMFPTASATMVPWETSPG